MTHWIAFLRGINVGGHRIIRMAHLQAWLGGAGLEQVRTYIQSGNASFLSPEPDPGTLGASIEALLLAQAGFAVPVMLRRADQLAALVQRNPFADVMDAPDTKRYVCFLKEQPAHSLAFPLRKPDEGLEWRDLTDGDACVVSRKVSGEYGFANQLVERSLKQPATARDWNTVMKIHQALA
jgi:uncharacterized protein (DUF1697 family)